MPICPCLVRFPIDGRTYVTVAHLAHRLLASGEKRVGYHLLDGDDHDRMLYIRRPMFAGSYD